MKRKGFTLVELLGVIVILAIITLLATSGYGKITKETKQKSYENLVQYIETKAANYAEETGNLITNVDTLVKNGYIEADNEQGDVFDPRNKDNKLNCHIVSIIKEGNLYGQFSEDEECDLGNLKIVNLNLNILKYKTEDIEFKNNPVLLDENKIESKDWTNKNVYLVATLGEKLKDQERQIKKITWISNVGSEEREVNNNFDSQNKYLVTAEQIINTNYTIQIELENNTIYQVSTSVKIDKQRPIIYEVFIERPNVWTNQKKVTITASDGNGSGMSGYAFIKDNNDCKEANYTETNENSFETTIKEVGTYYVCAKDKAGNYSEDHSSKVAKVEMIDTIPPECIWSGESTDWTRDDRTISLSCNDEGGSGCTLNNVISKTYDYSTFTDNWNYTIEDLAGNKTECNETIDVYVDKCYETEEYYGSWGNCSKSCDGGTQSRSVDYYSTFGSGFICWSTTEAQRCNTQSCPNNESSGDGDNSSGGSGGGNCSYAPDGSSNCVGMCGSPGADPKPHCCVTSGPCKK